MYRCPFCGCDPFHYVDIGVGYEPVAVTCCEEGVAYYQGESDEITMDRDTFMALGHKLIELRDKVERYEKKCGELE